MATWTVPVAAARAVAADAVRAVLHRMAIMLRHSIPIRGPVAVGTDRVRSSQIASDRVVDEFTIYF